MEYLLPISAMADIGSKYRTMPKGLSRAKNLTKDILQALAVTGCFVVASTSPYFLHSLVRSYFKYLDRKQQKLAAERISELRRKGMVSIQDLPGGKIRVELTKGGIKQVRDYELEDIKIDRNNKWDNKWRLLIYDIPHTHKKARDAFRGKIRSLGLFPLQKSVWVSAYECGQEIEILCGVFGLNFQRQCIYLTVNSLPMEESLRKWFDV